MHRQKYPKQTKSILGKQGCLPEKFSGITLHKVFLSNSLFHFWHLSPWRLCLLPLPTYPRQTAAQEIVTALSPAYVEATELFPPQLTDIKPTTAVQKKDNFELSMQKTECLLLNAMQTKVTAEFTAALTKNAKSVCGHQLNHHKHQFRNYSTLKTHACKCSSVGTLNWFSS